MSPVVRVFACLGLLHAAQAVGNADFDGWNYRHPGDWNLFFNITTCDGTREDARQSPINLGSGMADISVQHRLSYHDYACPVKSWITDDHTWEWVLNEGGKEPECMQHVQFPLEGSNKVEDWYIQQTHFHSPSEHTLAGSHYEAELHLVHRYHPEELDYNNTTQDKLLVIGIFLQTNEENQPNEALETYWLRLQMVSDYALANSTESRRRRLTEEDATGALSVTSTLYDMFITSGSYFSYLGSLTSPPCSEIVTWIMLEEPMIISRDQLDAMRNSVQTAPNSKASTLGGTNRPLQPINGRTVTFVPV